MSSVATAPGLKMQQRSRAEKALFFMHYRRLLIPLAAVYFGLMAFEMAAGYVYVYVTHATPKEFGQLSTGLDYMAMGLGALLALPVGTAVFSRAFKEQQMLFFHALPVSRRRQWLTLMASSAAALLTTYAAAVVFRPGMVRLIAAQPEIAYLLVLTVALLFAAGACFALVFTRPVAVYLSAVLVMFVLIGASVAFIIEKQNLYSGPKSRSGSFDLLGEPVPPPVIVPVILCFIVALFGGSLLFYVRGELVTLRRQLHNFALVLGVGSAITVGVTLIALAIAERRDETHQWQSEVSPSGRTLASIVRGQRYPWRASARIIDIDTGKRASVDAPGLVDARVVDDTVFLAERDMTLFSRKRSDRLVVASSSGRTLREVRFPGQEIMRIGPSENPITIATDDGIEAHVYQMTPTSAPREIAHAPVDQPPSLWMRRGVVIFPNRVQTPRAWLIRHGQAIEVPWAKATTNNPMPSVVRGVAFPDREAIVRQLERDTPLPRQPGDTVVYAIPSFWAADGEIQYLFGLRTDARKRIASIYVLPPNEKTWRPISNSVPLLADDVFSARPTFTDFRLAWLAMADRYGRIVYVDSANAKPQVRLYDAVTGRTVDVATLPSITPRQSVTSFARTSNMSVVAIAVRAGDGSILDVQRFLYDGTLLPIDIKAGQILGRRPDGTLIIAVERGLILRSPQGVTREVRIDDQ